MVLYLALGLGFLAVERAVPARALPRVPAWNLRVVLLHLTQLLALLVVAPLVRGPTPPLVPLGGLGAATAGGIAYLFSTLVWYTWHRARHEVRPLWLLFHQLHHSPSRIELATAFYKHPLEQLANAVLSGLVAGPLFGLGPPALLVYGCLAFGAELFYHLNVRTPRWLGWFVQRPEMHRVHHQRGRHAGNYGDLPVWDWLFGTLHNPPDGEVECGFPPVEERRVGPMLAFRDAWAPAGAARSLGLHLVTALGVSAVVGALLAPVAPNLGAAVGAVGKLSLAAPFPKVFCALGDTEPWAWSHELVLIGPDGTRTALPLDRDAALFDAPYQHRNALGAAVAYGPWLPEDTTRAALTWAACRGALRAGPPPGAVELWSRPLPGVPGELRVVEVRCDA